MQTESRQKANANRKILEHERKQKANRKQTESKQEANKKQAECKRIANANTNKSETERKQ